MNESYWMYPYSSIYDRNNNTDANGNLLKWKVKEILIRKLKTNSHKKEAMIAMLFKIIVAIMNIYLLAWMKENWLSVNKPVTYYV